MCNHQDCLSLLPVDFTQQVQYFRAGLAVKIPGGFIGKDNVGIIDKSAEALPLTVDKLAVWGTAQKRGLPTYRMSSPTHLA